MNLRAVNEWDALHTVVVGTARSMGGTPLRRCVRSQVEGTHPRRHISSESDCMSELMDLRRPALSPRHPRVAPQDLEDVNQIFARDVGVVIDDRFVAMRMISDRAAEWQASSHC